MRGVLFLMVFCVLVAQSGLAQPTQTVRGTVNEAESGAAVAGASVRLIDAATNAVHGGYTDTRGRFAIARVPSGTYTVVITGVGYDSLRIEDVAVSDQMADLSYEMQPQIVQKGVTIVTASRVEQKALEAPAAVTVVDQRTMLERPAQTPVEYLEGTAGVDQAHTGISSRNVNVRGFNNVFTGTLMTLTDYRLSGVPSLRANVPYFIPATNEDIQRIELVRGPGSALYGPNAAQGVINVITQSPFSSQGTSVFMTGGFRSATDVATDNGNYYSHVGARHAGVVGERFGYKVSGQYVNAWDWAYVDPEEERIRNEAIGQGANPDTLRIGKRDNIHRHFNVDARLDFILGDDANLMISGGMTRAISTIEMTDIGTQMGVNWDYYNVNSILTAGDLFAQAFYNKSDAGETYNLRTGNPLVDRSALLGTRLQYASHLGDVVRLTYGGDFFLTMPETDGTINGVNEDDDSYNEIGGYLQADVALVKDMLDLLVAGRVDKHSVLDDPVFSPRAALVYAVTPNQSLRATFNQAFTTPTSVDLFLDILSVPDAFGLSGFNPSWGVGVWASGTARSGYTFPRVNGVPQFRSQFDRSVGTHLDSASSNGVWESATGIISTMIQFRPDLDSATKALLQGFLQAVPAPQDIQGLMALLNPTTGAFDPVAGVTDVPKLKPTITTTFELGYQGFATDDLFLTFDAYYSTVTNFISGQAIITPNVFLSRQETFSYLQPIMKGALMQQGMPEQEAEATANAYAGQLADAYAQIPVGTVSPNETTHTGDILLAPRNFGELSYYGMDFSFQYAVASWLEVGGSLSYMAKAGGADSVNGLYWTAEEIGGVQDFSFNAPAYKSSLYANLREAELGLVVGARWRWTDAFTMISGVFVGDITAINMLDLNAQYLIPGVDGLRATLMMNNVLDFRATYFVGAPEIGRLTTFRLDYTF